MHQRLLLLLLLGIFFNIILHFRYLFALLLFISFFIFTVWFSIFNYMKFNLLGLINYVIFFVLIFMQTLIIIIKRKPPGESAPTHALVSRTARY